MPSKDVKIDVCVATRGRQTMLRNLLDSLVSQDIPRGVRMRIIVIDNDADASSADTVESALRGRTPEYLYEVEPVRNISLSRNRALAHASGDYVAFVDDDEWVHEKWLGALLDTARRSQADVIFGPVIPQYPENAPRWITRGRFFDRPRFDTGTMMTTGGAGNVLLSSGCVARQSPGFLAGFGETGGEDTEYFLRVHRGGGRLVWCDEAEAYEHVPSERMSVAWLVKRAFREGQVYARILHHTASPVGRVGWFLKRLGLLAAALTAASFSVVLGKHMLVLALTKIASNSGQLSVLLPIPHYKPYSR